MDTMHTADACPSASPCATTATSKPASHTEARRHGVGNTVQGIGKKPPQHGPVANPRKPPPKRASRDAVDEETSSSCASACVRPQPPRIVADDVGKRFRAVGRARCSSQLRKRAMYIACIMLLTFYGHKYMQSLYFRQCKSNVFMAVLFNKSSMCIQLQNVLSTIEYSWSHIIEIAMKACLFWTPFAGGQVSTYFPVWLANLSLTSQGNMHAHGTKPANIKMDDKLGASGSSLSTLSGLFRVLAPPF